MSRSFALLVRCSAGLIAAGMISGAGFDGTDGIEKNREIIAKLSADISKVEHSIQVTKALILRSPDATYLPDLHFRLAELFVEKSRYIFARLIESQPAGERTLAGDKALEVQITKKLAIETYDRLVNDFPEYPHNDQVRFFRAHEYRELGEWDTMVAQYKALIEKYPRSDWAIEARLTLGDYHFDKGELDQSEEHYAGILALPESHVHDMARYKLGWIRINQLRFKDALDYFEAAAASGHKKKHGAIGDAHSLDVKREALMAAVWPFSEVKKAAEAPAYFRRLADSKTIYVATLKKLANRYYIKTDYVSAAMLYREIVPLSADAEQNIEFVQRIYESVRNMPTHDPQRYSRAASDVAAIVDTLARYQNHPKYAEHDQRQLRTDFELVARDLATRLHMEAQQQHDKESAAVAAEAYRRYLSVFVDSPEKKAIQTNRAEALFQAEQFLPAALQYEEIAKTLGDGNEARDALYSSLLAFHRALDLDAEYREKHPAAGGLLNALDLLKSREGIKQVGAYYVKRWPEGEKTANVKFNIAKMNYQQGEYRVAAELFTAFVGQYPSHKDAPTAGNLALDSLHKLDDYQALANLADSFAKNTRISDVNFKNEAARLAANARQRKVELTVLSGSAADFSETILTEWGKHKGTQEGEEYLYAAFVKYKNDANVAGVFDFGGRLMGAHPSSTRLLDVLGTMASFAVRAADFDRAAVLFEEYYKRFPRDNSAVQMLASAARIRHMLGQDDLAAKALSNLGSITTGADKVKAVSDLLAMEAENGNWQAVMGAAEKAIAEDDRWLVPHVYMALADLTLGPVEWAAPELAKAVHLTARSDLDKDLQARAFFELGSQRQKDFDKISFAGAGSTDSVLARKLNLAQAVEQQYVAAINLGRPQWAIASLAEVVKMYRDLATFINSAPIPENLNASDRKQFEQLIGQRSQEYEQKGKETQLACAQKAEQLKLLTPFAARCVKPDKEVPVARARHKRVAGAEDEAGKREIIQLRQKLVRSPENLETILALGRRALSSGDYHLASLVFAKASEIDPRNVVAQNLTGLAFWQLGQAQEAATAFEAASNQGYLPAAANLASLYYDYGYDRLAKQIAAPLKGGKNLDLSSPDLCPGVRHVLEELSGP